MIISFVRMSVLKFGDLSSQYHTFEEIWMNLIEIMERGKEILHSWAGTGCGNAETPWELFNLNVVTCNQLRWYSGKVQDRGVDADFFYPFLLRWWQVSAYFISHSCTVQLIYDL